MTHPDKYFFQILGLRQSRLLYTVRGREAKTEIPGTMTRYGKPKRKFQTKPFPLFGAETLNPIHCVNVN
jgi:hypothetical protein